jgi:hypothetical protein
MFGLEVPGAAAFNVEMTVKETIRNAIKRAIYVTQ